jgi:hypothetical protein
MDVLRKSTRKSRMETIKNEQIKEIMGAKGKPDIIASIERKRLEWYGHVKRVGGWVGRWVGRIRSIINTFIYCPWGHSNTPVCSAPIENVQAL